MSVTRTRDNGDTSHGLRCCCAVLIRPSLARYSIPAPALPDCLRLAQCMKCEHIAMHDVLCMDYQWLARSHSSSGNSGVTTAPIDRWRNLRSQRNGLRRSQDRPGTGMPAPEFSSARDYRRQLSPHERITNIAVRQRITRPGLLLT
jgi:hypothetical protein